MMRTGRFGGRRSIATVACLAVLVGGPLAIAVLHQGFPVTDPELRARDVWVTNAQDLMAGRLNRQIEELDAAVAVVSNEVDVFQDGDDVLLYDRTVGSVERVDPAYTTLTQRIDVPPGSRLAYGGDVLAVLSPKGELWTTHVGGELSFDADGIDRLLELDTESRVAVSSTGTVFASEPSAGRLHTVLLDSPARFVEIPAIGAHELSAVGDEPVILDTESEQVIVRGRTVDLPQPGIRLQQSGPPAGDAWVATSDGLIAVPLGGGDVRTVPADDRAGRAGDAGMSAGEAGAASADAVAAPVRLGGCAHGAWAADGTYLAACDEAEPKASSIDQAVIGGDLEFRVNRDVIALNNLANGDAWLVDSDMRLVDNWDEVTPPEESDAEEGEEKSSQQTFEDTLAERTDRNRAPLARDDSLGARPGRATIVDLLANDTDPDGDVLVVDGVPDLAESAGRLESIDGGRALQFTPAEGFAGTASFRYTADDGRGGIAEASVDIRIVPESENAAPTAVRTTGITVESGQRLGTNVLADWIDPDGDDLSLVSASPVGGDAVRFSPDGELTFEHRSGTPGAKEVAYVVSDGTTSATGTLAVDVRPSGSADPVGTPDYARVFTGETIELDPLANDLSPSGAALGLAAVEDVPVDARVTPNLERGTIAFASDVEGSYLFLYDLMAGSAVSTGLIRVDVVDEPDDVPAPVAVRDTAYLRPGEPASVSLLANDVSPSGRVLAVQSVDDSATAGLVSVELLTNTVARVSATEALDRPLQFAYTISDGVNSAGSTVTVVPVPPIVKHQPPVAVDDRVTVRAGDIARVAGLRNDHHPDAAAMHLDGELGDALVGEGLAFVNGDTVRFQAPTQPGEYSVVYAVSDDFEQHARATVRFHVIGEEAENRPPLPTPLTSRTFTGSAVKIDVPLDGLDPDGDSVVLTGISTPPTLGRIVERTSTQLTYEAFAGSSGTDTFGYEVRDTHGATATGVVRIGVIPRAAVQSPPTAVDDIVELRPGRTASIEVLLNDSDPNGHAIEVADLGEVAPELDAEVRQGRRIVVRAPDREGSFSFRYEISNGHGGVDTAFVQVTVSDDAVIDPPTAQDQVLEPEDVVAGESTNVRPLRDATNPGGLVEDLAVSVEGPNASRATVLADGSIDVEPGARRYAVAYRLTNEVDDLSARAFVVVPAVPDGDRPAALEEREKTPEELLAEERAKFASPHLKDLGDVVVPMNGRIEWDVADLVEVPSGKPATILAATAMRAESSPFVDAETLRFVPEHGFRGEASVSFEVTDGDGAGDPLGRRAILTIPITVGDPGFRDTPPSFTPRSETIEAGEAPLEIDLRASSDHPNPEIVDRLEFTGLDGATSDVAAEIIDGSILRVSSPIGVQPGTGVRLTFDVGFDAFSVPGHVDIRVVSSTRPKPRAVDDGPLEMRRSESLPIAVLDNDVNPFDADRPLRVVDAAIDSTGVGNDASVSHTSTGITVRTGPAFSGTLSIVYRIEDATGDVARQTQGRATVIVRDRPDAPTITAVSDGDGAVTLTWRANASNNSPITGYTVSYGASSRGFPASADGAPQTITGLSNGTGYIFRVTATNGIGTSETSAPSRTAVPFGTPGAPTSARLDASSDGSGRITLTWTPPSFDGGRAVTSYNWRMILNSSMSGSTSGLSHTGSAAIGVAHRYEVQACNARACGAWTASNVATATAPWTPTNHTVVTTAACPEPDSTYNNPPTNLDLGCTMNPAGRIPAGTVIDAVCRSQRNGSDWFYMRQESRAYDGWFIRASDTNRAGRSVADC
ncbi:Ig-like domain-containing protein [Agromyces sp. SYSU K20354]|uniref:Ig-like domain-containing protein n=1 Tax=Agromyces cavernae TaxID=2898659 RepID=UPI001E365CFE|nr:Ig-like domain-containing protein [Agromyces cavernae]MCD2442498.1 Ig-like domain-containing protein [Agromyces cavernae]